jgi:hypothetical protein
VSCRLSAHFANVLQDDIGADEMVVDSANSESETESDVSDTVVIVPDIAVELEDASSGDEYDDAPAAQSAQSSTDEEFASDDSDAAADLLPAKPRGRAIGSAKHGKAPAATDT